MGKSDKKEVDEREKEEHETMIGSSSIKKVSGFWEKCFWEK